MVPEPRAAAGAPWWILLVAVAARLAAMIRRVDGMVYPDEIFQSIEPAHHAAFGVAALAWEWGDGLRSWLPTLVYAIPFRLADAAGLGDAGGLVRLSQCINVLLSLLVVDASHRIGFLVHGRPAARLAGFTAALMPILLFYAPRTLNDCASACLLMAGYAAFMHAVHEDGRRAEYLALLSGVLAGGAFAFRYTAPLFFLGPGLWFLVQRRWRPAAGMVLGFLGPFVLVGVVDWVTWGSPFASFARYVDFNVIQGKSRQWGVAPGEWYAGILYRDLGALAFGVMAVAVRGTQGLGGLGLGLLVGMIGMAWPEHKEERFLLPVWAMLPVLLALGATRLCEGMARGARVAAAVLCAVLLLPHAKVTEKRDWAPRRSHFAPLRYVAAQPDARGLIMEREMVVSGGLVSVHRAIPVVVRNRLLERKDITSLLEHELFNYLVVDEAGARRLRALEIGARWLEVHREGNMLIFRRE